MMLKKIIPPRVLEGLRYIRHGRLVWDRALPSFVPVAAMTTKEEQVLFTQAVRDVAGLRGEIVDLGCWLGSTTLSLARGLREMNDSGRVHAYDRFIWEAWMDLYSSEHWCDYMPGETFLPETRRRMGDLKPWVNLVQADLTTCRWDGGPIRLLLVDAMKSWPLTSAIAREFYPSLMVGALVLHQDYLSFNHPWISVLQCRLRDYFEYESSVSYGCTSRFKLTKQIPQEVLAEAIDFKQLQDDEAELSWQWSLEVMGERARVAMTCSRIMYYLGKGDLARARQLFARDEHIIDAMNIGVVKKSIAEAEAGDDSWAKMNSER